MKIHFQSLRSCHFYRAHATLLIAFLSVYSAAAQSFDLMEKKGAEEGRVNGKVPLSVTPQSGAWDLSKYDSIYFQIESIAAESDFDSAALRTAGTKHATVWVRAENDGAKGAADNVRTAVVVEPGEKKTLRLRLARHPEDPAFKPFEPFLMYFKDINVHENSIDPAKVARVVVWLEPASSDQTVVIKSVVAKGEGVPGPVPFFPFVDKYGQYIHADWPEKIHEDADFATRMAEEENNMRANWGPTDWDAWGGWINGPKMDKTGFFHTKKVNGKWYFVDPDGRLFWSYGPTGVSLAGEATPVTDRESWFAELLPQDSEFGKYWGSGKNAAHKYYQDKEYRSYNFGMANAERRYGKDWQTSAVDFVHRRLHKWGFNTIAAQSNREVMMARRTPYTVSIEYDSPKIGGMPDVFDPAWETALTQAMEKERGTTANDPWNIGYFVDRQLPWGNSPNAMTVVFTLMQQSLESHAAMAAFVKDLKAKYKTIGALNDSWNTNYKDWGTMFPSPDTRNRSFREDASAFGAKFADKYFSTVRKVVKQTAPKNLYLGVRLNGYADVSLIQIAANYVDVIPYNIYDDPAVRLRPYLDKVDKPFLAEFGVHSDLGQMPWRGSDYSQDPTVRSRELETYFHKAINEPALVGVHFFQFRDQPLTGRDDGEATLRGLVNVADTPHFDLVETSRHLSYDMYETRDK